MRSDRILEVAGVANQRPATSMRLTHMPQGAAETVEPALLAPRADLFGQVGVARRDLLEKPGHRIVFKGLVEPRRGDQDEHALSAVIGGNGADVRARTIVPAIAFVLHAGEVA